jgi:hypothetical protein
MKLMCKLHEEVSAPECEIVGAMCDEIKRLETELDKMREAEKHDLRTMEVIIVDQAAEIYRLVTIVQELFAAKLKILEAQIKPAMGVE